MINSFTDLLGDECKPGDYIVFVGTIVGSPGLRYGLVLGQSTRKKPDISGFSGPCLRVQSVTVGVDCKPIMLSKESILINNRDVLRVRPEQVHPDILRLLESCLLKKDPERT